MTLTEQAVSPSIRGDDDNDDCDYTVTAVVDTDTVIPPSKIGLYIHIPYCRQRCRYCNFAIVPIGINTDTNILNEDDADTKQSIGFYRMNQNYTMALLNELRGMKTQQSSQQKVPLKSIYFGGGTPSLMPIESLRQIMMEIFDEKGMFQADRKNCEITMEADPGTFTVDKLREWKELGFNRLSLGVQSFDDTILTSLGRTHRSNDIYEAIAMIRTVYGEDNVNYSIDLISGLPGLSIAKWIETLHIATTCLHPSPTHLSVYDLQIEQVRLCFPYYAECPIDGLFVIVC
jgi:coproporphyrinogen III oxidase-like Fe-S oxidoreductase